jgi:hypothetical protein
LKPIYLFIYLARDAEERQKWISNLEEAISLNSVNTVCIILEE